MSIKPERGWESIPYTWPPVPLRQPPMEGALGSTLVRLNIINVKQSGKPSSIVLELVPRKWAQNCDLCE